jgi:alkyl sulfatase BDS1-like metallo-beta-lactamase superfamily hydrolase
MPNQKDATRFTKAANKALLNELSWDDNQGFEFASRGFIASLHEPVITDANGRHSCTHALEAPQAKRIDTSD